MAEKGQVIRTLLVNWMLVYLQMADHVKNIQPTFSNLLMEEGNTVLVVKHHLDVIKCADWVIDLGPGGGESGGHIVTQGPPE